MEEYNIDEMVELDERDLYERYDSFLDECLGMVEIGGLEYNQSLALKNVDPIAYRCGFNDWLDSELSDDRIILVNNKYYEGE